MLPISIKDTRDRVLKQDVYFPRIKEQSEAMLTAFDKKCTVDIESNGLQWLFAMRTQLIRLFSDNCVWMPVFQIDIIMCSAV